MSIEGKSVSVCVYKGKMYHSTQKLADKRVLILSVDEETWDKYDTYRMNGEKKYIYSKIVNEEELDDFYALNYKVVYRGYLFSPRGKIEKTLVDGGKTYISIHIPPNPSELVEELGLEPCDRMEYGRFVTLKEIDYLVIEKTNLMGENRGQKEIRKVDLIEYVSNLPEGESI